jgi:hypothetical protein
MCYKQNGISADQRNLEYMYWRPGEQVRRRARIVAQKKKDVAENESKKRGL